jgi:transcriptional regulator with XRE-family HTH domain
MYSNQQKRSSRQVAKSRCEGGQWLRELREAQALSQRQLADKVGIEYYTFISQLECGHGRIPPDRYRIWAEALDVEARHFVQLLMHFYDPVTYQILFEGDQVPISRQAAHSQPSTVQI